MIKYFALCLLIWLKATKIIKIFISVIPFYGNKDICLGFVWLVLCALLLLKIIFSMEGLCRCFGVCRKMCGVCVCTFLKLLKWECVREKLSWFSLLHPTSSFKMVGMTFSSKLDWGSYIVSIAKPSSKKIGALSHSMKFFLLWLLCISINLP